MINKDSVNGARSYYYGLLSKLFVFSAKDDRFEGIDDALAIMLTNPMDTHTKEAMQRLLNAIDEKGYPAFIQEYDDIFHTPQFKPLRNTISFFDEGLESGKKRLEVKNFLAKTKIRRNEQVFKENEDSIGFLMAFMHELIELIIKGENNYENLHHCIFTEIINPYIDEFCEELFEHNSSDIYKDVAILLNGFMEFERLYFEVAKPPKKEKDVVIKEEEFISDAEAARRAANKAKKAADQEQQGCSLDVAYDVEDGI